MPNLDGIIWQNPTVMESLAPIVSDVTQRMEGAIQKNAALLNAQAAAAQKQAYQQKVMEAKQKAEQEKAAKVTLPNYVAPSTFEPVAKILQDEETAVLSEMGRLKLGLGYSTPEQTALTNRYYRIQLGKENWKSKYNDYTQYYDAVSKLDANDYDIAPTEHASKYRVDLEEYVGQNLQDPNVGDKLDLLDNYQMTFDYPAKKIPIPELKDIKIPNIFVKRETTTQQDKKGAKQSVTNDIVDTERFIKSLETQYEADPKLQAYVNANPAFVKYTDGEEDGIDFKKVAEVLIPHADKDLSIKSETDIEPKEKTSVVVNVDNGKGYSGQSKAKRKRSDGLEYEAAGVVINGKNIQGASRKGAVGNINTTSFYQANDDTLPSEIDSSSLSMPISNGKPTHILDENGEPVNIPNSVLKKASANNVKWLPFNDKGELMKATGKSGISPFDVSYTVPYTLYKDDELGTVYWIPAKGVSTEYEDIGGDVLKKDAVAYVRKADKVQEKETVEKAKTMDVNAW